MSGIELANAYVSIHASTKGMGRELIGQMREATGAAESEGRKAGGMFSKGLSNASTYARTALKGAALTAAGAIGTMAAVTISKGFGRLVAIDNAKGKLSGLGYSAKQIEGVMTNALAAVKGTAFGLDEAATVAASSMAAGVKQGKDLESYLRLVADAATIAGSDMGEMGAIFNKVAASGKIQGDTIEQLNERGIPILQFLAKHLGVTAAEAQKMASDSKVSFEDFRAAMQENLGGAAAASGSTFVGAWKNVMASFGRIGANALSSTFDRVKRWLPLVQAQLEKLEPVAKTVGAAVGRALDGMFSFLDQNKGSIGAFFSGVGAVVSAAIPPLVGMMQVLAGAIRGIVAYVSANKGWILPLVAGLSGVAGVIGTVVLSMKGFALAVAAVGAAAAGLKTAIASVKLFFTVLQLLALTNPFTAIVAGVVGVVAALGTLYATNGPFRSWVDGVVSGAKEKFSSLVGFFSELPGKVKGAVNSGGDWLAETKVKAAAGWELVSSAASNAFTKMWGDLQAAGALGAQVVGNIFTTIVTSVKTIIGNIFATLGPSVGQAVMGLGQVILGQLLGVAALIQHSLTGVVQLVVAVFTGQFNRIPAIFQTMINKLGAAVTGAYGMIVGGFQKLFSGMLGVLGGMGQLVTSGFQAIWSRASAIFSAGVNAVMVWVNSLRARVVSTITGMASSAVSMASSMWSRVGAMFSSGASRSVAFISSLPARVRAIFSSAASGASSMASSMWSRVVSSFSSGVSRAVSVVASLGGRVVSAIGNAGSWLWGAGQRVIQGFINGLAAGFGAVRSTLNNLTSMLPSWKGPPERDDIILKNAGQRVMDGFIDGLESRYGATKITLGQFTQEITAYTPAASVSGARYEGAGPREAHIDITVNNPIAEPTSVTTNRALNKVAMLSSLGGAL